MATYETSHVVVRVPSSCRPPTAGVDCMQRPFSPYASGAMALYHLVENYYLHTSAVRVLTSLHISRVL